MQRVGVATSACCLSHEAETFLVAGSVRSVLAAEEFDGVGESVNGTGDRAR